MPDLRQGCATGKERGRYSASRHAASIRGDGRLEENIPVLYDMVQHHHFDVPVLGVARAGRTNEHLKERALQHPALHGCLAHLNRR
jgi:hypothetical protein